MKNFKTFAVVFTAATLSVFTSCEKESSEDVIDQSSQEISKDVLNKISELHFNPNGVEKITLNDINGTQKTVYKIEDDILFTENQLMKTGLYGGIQNKQYRTNNTVTATNVIRVVGYNGNNQFGLSATAQTGLRYAVDNYNNENLDIRFELSFGTNWGPNDILVFVQDGFARDDRFPAGIAGFPSNGFPFNRVRINTTASTTQTDQQLEHLLAHEIGHCIGFRHTDWDTRKSCGENNNEGAGNDGLVFIPGTAGPGGDDDSIMNACYPANTDGEWSNLDRVALNFLY
ncbi:hypothetical protein ATO12_21565 [Aquimarina atlantica]|uniref:Peptidase n=1 Tax=Aquimarina atlantica TaxID=1317122 RepID=A0A023BRV8_9FLAO|nr:M57 family metalloprotease [Aquimarina atlantica]EZH72725.1 hypothetical protein ATO12_21565 [Aquimarina atlantica]